MPKESKKLTLGDLLQQKRDYDLHTSDKWDDDLRELIALSKSGDGSAIHVLLKIALDATQAIEELVVEGKAPIRFFSAIAPTWPIIQNATPHVPPVVPGNLGKYSAGPLDLSKVFKLETVSRSIMFQVVTIIHYLREYHTTIHIQNYNMATKRGWPGKISTKVNVPGGDENDTFELVSFNEQMKHLKYEFHLHSLITSRFVTLLEFLELPLRESTFVFAFETECVNLPDEVDHVWQSLSQKILTELAGEALTDSPVLQKLGKANAEKNSNRAGEVSNNTGNVEELIRRRLNSAFKNICKDF